MKKFVMFAILAATALSLSACCSLRTPQKSENKDKVWYGTFFGLSIESAVYGDGFLVK